MDRIEAIEERISRRSYLEEPIPLEKLAVLLDEIDQVNSESGLTVAFAEDGSDAFDAGKSYGLFSGVRSLLVFKGEKELPHLREKVGYYGERLLLAATQLGLGSCWVGGTFDKKSPSLHTEEWEEIVCVSPVGCVRREETLKEKVVRAAIHRGTKSIAQMIRADRPLTPEETRAMELVQRAPTARNTQKVQFRFEGERISAWVPDDYPFDLVDLGICKYHFEAGMEGRFQWGNGGVFCPGKERAADPEE